MQRRLFIQSSLVGMATWFGSAHATATDRTAGAVPTWTLYDPRFAGSRAVAQALSYGSPLLPVGGDVTDLAALLLPLRIAPRSFTMTGVTTESIPFCLQQLLHSPRIASPRLRRLDSDLFVWTLTTGSPT